MTDDEDRRLCQLSSGDAFFENQSLASVEKRVNDATTTNQPHHRIAKRVDAKAIFFQQLKVMAG